MKNVIRGMLSIICSALVVSPSWAVGAASIGNEVPSARAAGQGYVGIAGQNNDPTAVYVNPAALTSLNGTQVTIGSAWENIHGDYQDNSGRVAKMRSIDVAVPNMAVTQSFLGGRIGSGLSVQSPYGLETHWSGDSPLRYIATNSVLHMVIISPAVAYQVNPKISVGAAADYVNLFDAALEKHVNSDVLNGAIAADGGYPALPPGSPDANSKLFGTAANWGYHGGLVFKPNDQNAIGLTYHSRVKLHVNGTLSLTQLSGYGAAAFGGSTYQTSAYTDLYLPQNIQFGYSYKPSQKWMLEADAAWYDWSPNHDLNVRAPSANPAIAPILTAGSSIPLNWRNCWSFASGANYKVNEKLQVRGGVWYEPWVEPESSFDPALIDLTRYGVSTGFGYAFTDSFSIDAAYTAIFFHNRTINNNLGSNTGIPGYSINGSYSNFVNLTQVNFTYRFNSHL